MATTRIKAAAVINEHGKWFVYGWHGSDDDDTITTLLDGFDEAGQNERIYWLTAELEVPEAVTVEASVHDHSKEAESQSVGSSSGDSASKES